MIYYHNPLQWFVLDSFDFLWFIFYVIYLALLPVGSRLPLATVGISASYGNTDMQALPCSHLCTLLTIPHSCPAVRDHLINVIGHSIIMESYARPLLVSWCLPAITATQVPQTKREKTNLIRTLQFRLYPAPHSV